jgi:hypothetical protein
MKSILTYFKRKFKRNEEMEYLNYIKELNPNLQNNINSWSSSVAKEMETQLLMLIDLQRKLHHIKKEGIK